jgi:hypothetical protein
VIRDARQFPATIVISLGHDHFILRFGDGTKGFEASVTHTIGIVEPSPPRRAAMIHRQTRSQRSRKQRRSDGDCCIGSRNVQSFLQLRDSSKEEKAGSFCKGPWAPLGKRRAKSLAVTKAGWMAEVACQDAMCQGIYSKAVCFLKMGICPVRIGI